jgi:hypothetical protein
MRQRTIKTQNMIVLALEFTNNSFSRRKRVSFRDPRHSSLAWPLFLDAGAFHKVAKSRQYLRGIHTQNAA